MRKAVFLGMFCLLFGCSTPAKVHVQRYLESKEERASIFVGSPDPSRDVPLSEKFLIRWNRVPAQGSNPYLELEILYGDLSVESVKKAVSQPQGIWIYKVRRDSAVERGGILTYRVLLKEKESVLAEWDDLLWFSMISKEN